MVYTQVTSRVKINLFPLVEHRVLPNVSSPHTAKVNAVSGVQHGESKAKILRSTFQLSLSLAH